MRDDNHQVKWEISLFSHDCYFALVHELFQVADFKTLNQVLPCITRALAQATAKHEAETTVSAPNL